MDLASCATFMGLPMLLHTPCHPLEWQHCWAQLHTRMGSVKQPVIQISRSSAATEGIMQHLFHTTRIRVAQHSVIHIKPQQAHWHMTVLRTQHARAACMLLQKASCSASCTLLGSVAQHAAV